MTQLHTTYSVLDVKDHPRDLLELGARFSTEAAYLFQLRWPEGFYCERCEGWKGCLVSGRRSGRWECDDSHGQSGDSGNGVSGQPSDSLISAAWRVTSQKDGVSAMGLRRVLGLKSYNTAWTLLHNLRHAMVRPRRDRLSGRVESYETYLGR